MAPYSDFKHLPSPKPIPSIFLSLYSHFPRILPHPHLRVTVLLNHYPSCCPLPYENDSTRGLDGLRPASTMAMNSAEQALVIQCSSFHGQSGRFLCLMQIFRSPDQNRFRAEGIRPSLSNTFKSLGRIWDARTGAAIDQPLKRHTVQSVAAPDGQHIISSPYDRTIRIWDATTGAAIGQPLEGHTSRVFSVPTLLWTS
jgi:WD40 repeat protein